eukprot:4647324-Alexandrium_andersonii.AAC.1
MKFRAAFKQLMCTAFTASACAQKASRGLAFFGLISCTSKRTDSVGQIAATARVALPAGSSKRAHNCFAYSD